MAERVFQVLGDHLTKALLTADFDLYQSILTLPVTFSPKGGKAYTLRTKAELHEDFNLYVSIIRLHGVTDIYRQFLGVDQEANGDVSVRVMTHILVRATLLAEPFDTRMRLRPDGDGWRIAEIESSEGHLNWALGRADISPQGKFTPKEG